MQFQKPILRQEQKLKLNQQLLQSIQLMALPIQDLRLKIQEELEKNPALEILEDFQDASIEELSKKPNDDDADYFEDSSDPGYDRYRSQEESDNKQKFLEGALARPESLQDYLLWQLKLQPIDNRLYKIGELLIRNLDESGFHIEDPELLVDESDKENLEKAIKLIQSLDPVGVCTKNYKESLRIQILSDPAAPEQTLNIFDNYFDLIEKNKVKETAKKSGIGISKIEDVVNYLKKLSPFPGRKYSNEKPKYVIPDVMVKIKDGNFVVILNDEEIPILGINPFFEEYKEEKNKDKKDVNKFINASVKEAKWFIRSINQRNSTLLKIVKAIVEFQREFFLKGPKSLVPLTLKDVADTVSVHETTVSRIANSKYIQTEWGIFEIKYFFTNSISGTGSSGSRFSKGGVKQVIKEIIEQSSETNLSDQKISDILKDRGINIARRTVAKYRQELNISASYNRNQ